MVLFAKVKLGNILEFSTIPQAKSQQAIPDDCHFNTRIQYVVQSISNNMVGRFVSKPWLTSNYQDIEEGNAIALGVTLPAVSYQYESFAGSQLIIGRGIDGWLNRYTGLYLETAISKLLYQFSYGKKPGVEIYKQLKVVLPVLKDPVASPDDLDVQYMEQYIKRVEADYTKRVEAYLATLGYESLDDCELSSQDLKVLSGPKGPLRTR